MAFYHRLFYVGCEGGNGRFSLLHLRLIDKDDAVHISWPTPMQTATFTQPIMLQ